MECFEKLLDGLLFWPEITVQDGQVGDRTLPLLGDYLIQRWVGVEAVPWILRSVQPQPPRFEYTNRACSHRLR